MDHDEPNAPTIRVAPPSRWARAVRGDGEAMSELAGSYWYCAYAWCRAAGLDTEKAGRVTIAGLAVPAMEVAQSKGGSRLREWLPVRLRQLADGEVTEPGEPVIEIDAAWAEERFGEEPPGEPGAIFSRRWALTVLDFTMGTLREDYGAAGQETLFTEVAPFIGFEGDDERYTAAAERLGLTLGAVRKAVFDFRTRHRALLRSFVSNTVLDAADVDGEITALLCACDAPGPKADTGALPEAIRELKPDELFVRALQTVWMSGSGAGGWTPPGDHEMARLFPQYEMLGMIGRGGMGAVYKARQVLLDRFVAIKLLPLEVSVDQEFADRFVREAQTMARLSHPNIIAVHDFGKTGEGHLYFAMEFVDGVDLQEMIHGRPASAGAAAAPANLAAERALEIVATVCDALHYAHGKGVVHRDIKPANILVAVDGRVKVGDFGLARRLDADPSRRGQTTVGTVLGTPEYMAPEQTRGLEADHRADIFSVGVVLYEMLCKEVPRGVFEPASQRVGSDPRIDDVLTKAMQQQPERRFQDIMEMKGEMERIRNSPPPKTARAGAVKLAPVVRAVSAEEISSYSFLPKPGADPRTPSGAGPGRGAAPDGDKRAAKEGVPAALHDGTAAAAPQRKSKFGWWIGLVMVLLILAAIGYVFFFR